MNKAWMPADWPAPGHIHAGTTTRPAGVSRPPFDGFNLAGHVGDDPQAVAENRLRLQSQLNLPAAPTWLQQRHSSRVVEAIPDVPVEADGAYTGATGRVCAVLTADCIPLLLCNKAGSEIAAVHIGWRGLSLGIIKNALVMFNAEPRELLAWLGPCISQRNYEIGTDVITACLGERGTGDRFEICPQSECPQSECPQSECPQSECPQSECPQSECPQSECPQSEQRENKSVSLSQVIRQSRTNHWFLDLGQLVKTELRQQGVEDIYGCNLCTYNRKDLFYSYRRDGVTGRMASMIWVE